MNAVDIDVLDEELKDMNKSLSPKVNNLKQYIIIKCIEQGESKKFGEELAEMLVGESYGY